jgi:hypothetical protein
MDEQKEKRKQRKKGLIPIRFRRFLGHLLEGGLAILLVMLFFSVFLYFLNMIFPTGTGLKALVGRHGTLQAAARPGDSERDIVGDESQADLDAAATLTWTRNNVKAKGSEAIAWQTAQTGKRLFDRDAVQTLGSSAAEVTFDENSVIDMGSNSLLIIKKMTQDPVYREKRSFMVLVDGDLRGKLAGTGSDDMYLEIGTPGAMVTTQSGPQAGGPVDFKISVNPDQSSTIAVYNGTAEVTAQGQKVLVGANQATVVRMGDAPLAPGMLPDPVILTAPANRNTYYYRDLPPEIAFRWKSPFPATGYHFVLARDHGFRDIVTDEVFSNNRFKHGNLQEGIYYWKVSATADTIEGIFSETRRIKIVQDQTPPSLFVRFPPETLYRGYYELSGKAEPGARVFIGGQRIETTRTGKFEYRLKLKPGMNVIVVEAFDAVDNVAYQTKRVISKY